MYVVSENATAKIRIAGCMSLSKRVLLKLPKELLGTGVSYRNIPQDQFDSRQTAGLTLGYFINVAKRTLEEYEKQLKGSTVSRDHSERLQLVFDNGQNPAMFKVGICHNYVQRAKVYRRQMEKSVHVPSVVY